MGNLVSASPPAEKTCGKKRKCDECTAHSPDEYREFTKRVKREKTRTDLTAELQFFHSLYRYDQTRWLYAFVGLCRVTEGELDRAVIRIILTDWMHVSCLSRWWHRSNIEPLTEPFSDKNHRAHLSDEVIRSVEQELLARVRQQRQEMLDAGCSLSRICLLGCNYPFDGLGAFRDYDEEFITEYFSECAIRLPMARFYTCIDGLDDEAIQTYLCRCIDRDEIAKYQAELRAKLITEGVREPFGVYRHQSLRLPSNPS